uniref:Uncharacterized protein n=1 Tax=Odontella aurita TaxID=265563 RepID=A0A7S4N0K2_9STRA
MTTVLLAALSLIVAFDLPSVADAEGGYCAHRESGCNGVPQLGSWCHSDKSTCVSGDCGVGTWCTSEFSYCSVASCGEWPSSLMYNEPTCHETKDQCEDPYGECGGNWCTMGSMQI